MKTLSFALLLMGVSLISSCSSRSVSASNTPGEDIHKEVIKSGFSSHELAFDEISWSGSSGTGAFQQRDNFIVRNASPQAVASIIEPILKAQSSKRGWTSHGSGRTGDRFIRISFEEGQTEYFMDYVLFQKDSDVEVFLLYKGVAL
ncbi:hypothetical protein OAB00_03295 [Akkermansiaceae bacterium]|nr:hypothetical protein [Akkermansiaceae bacterium]